MDFPTTESFHKCNHVHQSRESQDKDWLVEKKGLFINLQWKRFIGNPSEKKKEVTPGQGGPIAFKKRVRIQTDKRRQKKAEGKQLSSNISASNRRGVVQP